MHEQGTATVGSVVFCGMRPRRINVRARWRAGTTTGDNHTIDGLPDGARDTRVRVRSSLAHLAIDGVWSVDVDAPTSAEGPLSSLDLPIAVAVAAAAGMLAPDYAMSLHRGCIVGELSLSGMTRPVRGVTAVVEAASGLGFSVALVPSSNQKEAAAAAARLLSAGLKIGVHGAPSLLAWEPVEPHLPKPTSASDEREANEARCFASEVLSEIDRLAMADRSVLLDCGPGLGFALARRYARKRASSDLEIAEAARVHSLAGFLSGDVTLGAPPLRAPHHTVSELAMTGGGQRPRPGEIALSHGGTLYLDNASEFRSSTLEAVFRAYAERVVRTGYRETSCVWPAHFGLIGSIVNAEALTPKPTREQRAYLDRAYEKIAHRFDERLVVARRCHTCGRAALGSGSYKCGQCSAEESAEP